MTREDFKSLFDANFNGLRNYLYYRSGDKELATDIAQECFLRIWEKQPKGDPAKLKGLLFKIGHDIFISEYRHAQTVANFAFQNNDHREESDSPQDELQYQELEAKYQRALQSMSDKLRVVFLMSREEELKNREIAERLGVSVKAVEKRMTKALKFLKETLL
ncbi:sigma-70 family RNA polymerase sigma factor [Marinilabilia salmonicolor]|uniref:RNA polymerase sigma-70 factor (ECF subfamily) n=1 Tax=Marinilabilia salmonicolor TaxID=989 RepID=A0A2T0XAI7_9BACT|nr:sigma-70 family RNA polymerase sigma factor [Marinilabilia salmonicolor]PRY95894.1 RNA polymerase sigma-70 factor (ECF subfamily) [Marinilabilia salmonicolor]RCW28913.1 RNA polymerase sigma-70 factor (ECF subfamily) [Marinilabilia salmonicolor]